MEKPHWLKNKVLILGLGREGQGTLRFFRKHFPDVELAVADMRPWSEFSPEEQAILETVPDADRHFGPDYLDSIRNFEVIFKTPGENRRKPQIRNAISRGALVTSATNLFFDLKQGKVIAVTGSKGKSTTTSLIYTMMKTAGMKVELVGNIGRAALDYLEDDAADKYYVFEISSYQLEDYRGGADLAVLVSFFPDHLDYHGGLENYFKAKMQLVTRHKKGLRVIYNYANDAFREYFETFARFFGKEVELIPFNDGNKSLIRERGGRFEACRENAVLATEGQIKLDGKHNLENVLAVGEVAALLGIPVDIQQEAFRSFIPLEHRLEPVGVFRGIHFYNDAISTTPESTMAALEALGRKRAIDTLFVGGLDRGYRFVELAQKILDAKIHNVFLLPETGTAIERAIKRFCRSSEEGCPRMVHGDNLNDLVAQAYSVTRPGTICLLSCAAPSYNLFKNFEERGRLFKEAVKKMA